MARTLVILLPIRPPTIALRPPRRIRYLELSSWPIIIYLTSKARGGIFCQERRRIQGNHSNLLITEGTQKCPGNKPSFKHNLRINKTSKYRPQSRKIIIPEKNSTALLKAWMQKYFRVASLVSDKYLFPRNNNGIKPRKFNSIPTQTRIQLPDVTVTTGPSNIIKIKRILAEDNLWK